MFEEDFGHIYESGPEEDEILDLQLQIGGDGVRPFRVTNVFYSGSHIPPVIEFTDAYDEFLTALTLRYPQRSTIQDSTQELIRQYNENNAGQGLRIFCPRFLTREQLLQFLGTQNRGFCLQQYEQGIQAEIQMSALAPNTEVYMQQLQQRYQKRNPSVQEVVVPLAPPPKISKKIAKRRHNSLCTDFQLEQVIAARNQLLAQGKKPAAKIISEATGVKPNYVYQILYKDRLNQALRQQQQDKFSSAQVPQNIKEEFIRYSLVPDNSATPVTQRATFFNQTFQVNFHYKVYLNILKESKFTYRRLKITNAVSNQGTTELQRLYTATILSHVVNQPYMDILAFDESGFSLSLKPAKAWWLRGTGPVLVPGIPKSKNLTYIACISMRQGLVSHQLVDQPMSAAIFFNFLQKSIQEYRYHDNHSRVIILMDNVPLHLKKEMIPDLAPFGCDFIYNASYTPLFNPIEEFFGTIKGKLSFYRIANINQLKRFILTIADNTDLHTIKKYYLHSFIEMMNCIRKVQ